MTFAEAEILITEAHRLGYRGTDWERAFIQRLEALQPAVLLPKDAVSVNEFYKRAAGGGSRERHQIINCKHRYNPD